MRRLLLLLPLLFVTIFSEANNDAVILGDEQPEVYVPLLKGKRVALFSNQSGLVGNRHILDVLIEKKLNVVAIFSPEHGFRGQADAGELLDNSKDKQTGVPVLSLYNGKNVRPTTEAMNSFDVLVVDIQDVGLRFYTYYVTMYNLMDACADYGKQVVILDRPNPNGFYVDGPILDMKYKSGVGALPIPIVYGMTLGELARMIVGEHWLKSSSSCNLTVVPCRNYTHQTRYRLPVAPSPNLPTMKSVYLYPSLCYFEATPVSIGRGSNHPFEVYGHPNMIGYSYEFTPRSSFGAKNPIQKDKLCHGVNLDNLSEKEIQSAGINLKYVIDAYNNLHIGDFFFSSYFEKLIGVDWVRKMIEQGHSADEIKAHWQPDVEKFKQRRRPYLLYKE
jgi:uncharacterized protein YbbC (DUF1343 family)